ncbi:MAG TPA: metallophosphoesterase [Verrucomicrobiae bacterium]|nr:metallophosphoesterase [Verrucomicrobiae bacterium]
MKGWRIALFIAVALTVWALVHGYVFSRLGTIPWVAAHCPAKGLVLAALALWVSYPLARILNASNLEAAGAPLEFAAALWMGVLFLLFVALLAVDLVTIGGLLFSQVAPQLRSGAILVAGIFSIIGLVQGLRAPLVRDYEVRLAGLPRERDGLVLVAISDLHLGTLKGHRWLTQLVGRVNGLKPDLVVVVGDLVDANVQRVETLLPVLKQLRPPLGVWTVTGNHEYYAGLEWSVTLLETAGYNLLRDCWTEAVPGLIIAGVDDLTARVQFGQKDNVVEQALANRPAGATILLSHSPLESNRASAAGVNLMLSGHTHAGQIWPFNFLVRLKYPMLAGRYEVDGMTLIVGRGTGTWGPPMRLWLPGEILRITLRTWDSKTTPPTAPRKQNLE